MGKSGHNDEPKTRGRKRNPAHSEAILRAAGEQLLDVGFERFRVQDVAARAGCGISAIYRRWSNKEALIVAALRQLPAVPAVRSEDPLADLRAVIHQECASFAERPDRVPGMVAAMQTSESIQQVIRDDHDLERFRSSLARLLGEDHPQLPLLSELVPAVLLFRAVFRPEALLPDETTRDVMALVAAIAAGEPAAQRDSEPGETLPEQ